MDRYFVLYSGKGDGWKWKGFQDKADVGPFLEQITAEGFQFFVVEGRKIEARETTETVMMERTRYSL